jgi:hypothetical protein
MQLIAHEKSALMDHTKGSHDKLIAHEKSALMDHTKGSHDKFLRKIWKTCRFWPRAARTRLLGSFTREKKCCAPPPPSLLCIIASRVRLIIYIETDRESPLGFSYTYV